jgi:surfeit locus 1 family protein
VNERVRGRRGGVVVPAILTLILVAGLIALGIWQINRKAWKEALIETLTQRLAAAPSELPPPSRWAELTQAEDEYRRVRFTAELVPGEDALIFTSGSTFRPDVSGPGYWVFAPARLAGGNTVVVDRGFLPNGQQDPAARDDKAADAPLEMVGVMRWPEPSAWFTPAPEPGHNLWFVRDQLSIAKAKNWGEVAPFFIELESPRPPGGLPIPGPLKATLPDNHLQYAIIWFSLAAVVATSFGFWLRGRLHEPTP